MAESPASVDVVVVGAGLAGLMAARELVRAGLSVVVVEGRDRVGGRTLNATVAGTHVDLGGTFVGPTQREVLALAEELGIAASPTYDEGANLVRWRGRTRRYKGMIPFPIGARALLGVGWAQWRYERLARGVPPGAPWTAKRAKELDGQTLASWLRKIRAGSGARELMTLVSRLTWACEPEEVSLLHALHYTAAAGGMDALYTTTGGAQDRHFHLGAQTLSTRLADALPEGSVVLERPARKIEWSADGAVVRSHSFQVAAKAVVIAVAPQHRADIRFAPQLPLAHHELPRRWPQGVITKAYAVYETPFWREAGLSGQSLSDTGPIEATFDASPSDGSRGVLLGFAGGDNSRAFERLPEGERRKQALAAFAALFGERALRPVGYLDQRWSAEEISPGGPTAAVPPGSWTRYGPTLAEPVGPIYWAGTETADRWTGFLDGAVSSGKRAAAEVLARLG